MPMKPYWKVLRERRDYLNARIMAKQLIGWDVNYDKEEREALKWALKRLEEFKDEQPGSHYLAGGRGDEREDRAS